MALLLAALRQAACGGPLVVCDPQLSHDWLLALCSFGGLLAVYP